MASVSSFRAVQYAAALKGPGADLSALLAPPYDVLDAEAKAALLRKSDRNIVAIDLPHIPPKTLGPASAYEGAAAALRQWLLGGTLMRRAEPCMFVYRQRFTFNGAATARTGMICTLPVAPFGPAKGGGILPHEETFSGPKEDRMALMKATQAQLSPIFGLHQDETRSAATMLATLASARPADSVAVTDDGTRHEVWTIADQKTCRAYADALAGEDVFIADGHHRYTTQLNYCKALESAGSLAADHPARRCMFVLISMSDPGLVIGPTHRILGGMKGYSWDAFVKASAGSLSLTPVPGDPHALERAMKEAAARTGRNALGLYDFASRRCFVAQAASADPLAKTFAAKPPAWRTLDVALVQYLIVEGIAQPALNGGQPVQWAFPHSIDEVLEIGSGKEKGSGGGKAFVPQLGVIVLPTPLEAVRAVSRAGELMPQKSTFFYPKLATGLCINPLS